MKNYVILTDTRQQKEEHILKEFDKQRILHIQTKLDSADYMALRYDEKKGFYKDYSILVDTKKDLLEICGNLAHTSEHARLVREVELGQSLGATDFIFLIGEKNIKTIDEYETIGIIICKQDNEYVIKYCSYDRIIAREYELV